MNKVTMDIAKLLGITVEDALQIQDRMENSGFDFSECTNAEFNKEAKITLAAMFFGLTEKQHVEHFVNTWRLPLI